jgi:hypothetical protein
MLSLGGTQECPVDSGIIVVEDRIAAGRVGEALENEGLLWLDAEMLAELSHVSM